MKNRRFEMSHCMNECDACKCMTNVLLKYNEISGIKQLSIKTAEPIIHWSMELCYNCYKKEVKQYVELTKNM